MFDYKQYDFVDSGLHNELHENYEDIIEDKIFKFRYRQNSDTPQQFFKRTERVRSRFMERARTRDPTID
jgi:hypothetical protein